MESSGPEDSIPHSGTPGEWVGGWMEGGEGVGRCVRWIGDRWVSGLMGGWVDGGDGGWMGEWVQ